MGATSPTAETGVVECEYFVNVFPFHLSFFFLQHSSELDDSDIPITFFASYALKLSQTSQRLLMRRLRDLVETLTPIESHLIQVSANKCGATRTSDIYTRHVHAACTGDMYK